jgi:mono/diheme cytochrome c family protein
MKRVTAVLQIVALALTALFVVSLFTSSFPPWSGDDDGGDDGDVAVATTAAAPETTVAGGDTTAEGAGTTVGGGDTTAAADTTAASGVDGEALYNDECASCHADDGGGGLGPSLQNLESSFPDQSEVVAIVTDGSGSMPGFGDDLSADEIDAIVAYIYTFG